jgi:hypothetical protein
LLTRHLFINFFSLQTLLPTGNMSGIGTSMRIEKISKPMSGSMCNGFMIIAIGGMGGQEEHLQ